MSSNELIVSDNDIGGDFAGRDLYKTTIHKGRESTAMTRIVEQYRAETAADKALMAWTAKLEHFLSNAASPDIRSLEEKLRAAGRDDIIATALLRKQAASKAILRQQGSKSAQSIFSFLMADIVVNFDQFVLPLVQAGASRSAVDAAISQSVIDPALSMLEENPMDLDRLDIQSLVYFLAGNCYIRWDKC
jgi:hypothetical protein